MLLTKTNTQPVEFEALQIREFWMHVRSDDAIVPKVVIETDESTRITYEVNDTPEDIRAMALLEGVEF